mmetsp:Transcript_87110/g.177533  ORF Transcript_87110/g.177533 Transcript_87110/m.177533 type:complete len:138 (+) Transcript_87110:306-719(+)
MHPRLGSKLSKPSKVASILDWKKAFNNTVLAVNFHKNRVGIAVASHPSLGIPCRELEPLRFDGEGNNNNGTNKIRNKKNIAGAIDRECLERFSEIIETHKVRSDFSLVSSHRIASQKNLSCFGIGGTLSLTVSFGIC